MGLFQKLKVAEKKASDELPNYVDTLLESTRQPTNDEIDERFSIARMSLNTKYGIDHAMALMRGLPNENSNVIISVVTKTLESANINVSNIIEDAKTKEGALHAQIKHLNEEITALETQIAAKKEQIHITTAILEETCKVREMLENAEQQDSSQTPAANSYLSSVKKEGATEKAELSQPALAAKLAIEAV
ncbi:MAG TPA: hypothetical protein VIM41_12250 [Gammaproteobacteria bacterium]